MKILKWISPDFYIGRMLIGVKAILEIEWLLVSQPTRRNFRFGRLVLRVKPKFTMVKNRNLKVLYDLVNEASNRHLPGDIVECGVWNGGSAAVMGAASMDAPFEGEVRTIWLFDSFQGLPPPGEQDGNLEKRTYFTGWNKGDVTRVKEVFAKIGYPSEKLKIVPGWFNETLAQEPIKDIAILHIDADWYESVKSVLQTFFHRVVPGGFIVLDDYGLWPGCRKALMDYLAEHHISGIAIREIGKQGAFFQKPLGIP